MLQAELKILGGKHQGKAMKGMRGEGRGGAGRRWHWYVGSVVLHVGKEPDSAEVSAGPQELPTFLRPPVLFMSLAQVAPDVFVKPGAARRPALPS